MKDRWIEMCRAEAVRLREGVEPLKAGRIRLFSQEAGKPSVDVTAESIAHDEKNAEMYEGLVKHMEGE